MFKFALNLTTLMLFSLFVVSCNKDDSPAENNFNNFQANMIYEPQYMPNGAKYLFNFYAIIDDQMDSEGYQFRFDANNDGIYEQDWSEKSSYTMNVYQPEQKSFKLDVKSSNGQIQSCIDTINLAVSLTQPHDKGASQGDAVWDKSGSNKIAFTWLDQIGTGLHDTYIADYSSGDMNQITSGNNIECKHYPEWSADGSKIFFTYRKTISYVDVNTKVVDTLINNVEGCYSIACSKDGAYLYFCGTGYDGVENIYGLLRYTFATKTLEKISDFNSSPIAINPDGTKIAAGRNELTIFDLTQLQVVKTYNTGKIQEDRIEWSPNGRYITLTYVDSTSSIRILDIEEEKYINITVLGFSDIWSWGYTWSPDGTMLAFTGAQKGKTKGSLWCIKPNLD